MDNAIIERIKLAQDSIKQETDLLGVELAKTLGKAAEIAVTLRQISNSPLWKDPQYGQHLEELGLVAVGGNLVDGVKAPKKAGRKARTTFGAEALLKFMGKTEVTAHEVQKHFGCSYITAGAKLKSLAKGKLAVAKKKGVKVFYRAL